MSDIISIANTIAGDSLLASWNPVVSFVPDFELKDLANKKCCVIPMGVEYKNTTRGHRTSTYKVEIGLAYRSKPLNLTTVIPQISMIVVSMLNKTYAGAICTAVGHDPLYSADYIREKGTLVSIITLTLVEVTNG